MRSVVRVPAVLVCVVLGVALLASPARARDDDPWERPMSVYFDMRSGVEWVDLPEATAFRAGSNEGIGATDDQFSRYSNELAIGFVDGDGFTLPDPIGRNARVELRGRFATGKSSNHETTSSVGIVTPSGGLGGAIAAAMGGGFLIEANTELETWDADLLYQTDVVLGPLFSFSPFAGLTYTRMKLDNDFKVAIPTSVVETNDHVESHYFGGVIGGDLIFRPAPALELDLGVRVDLMGAYAALDVEQDNRFISMRISESDSDSDFAARTSASLGFKLHVGPVTFGVEGYGRWLSYLPHADHPRSLQDSDSYIDDEDMWSAGANASVTIWFR